MATPSVVSWAWDDVNFTRLFVVSTVGLLLMCALCYYQGLVLEQATEAIRWLMRTCGTRHF